MGMYALIILPFLSMLVDSFRGRAVLQLELMALRHQLAVSERTSPRPNLPPSDRLPVTTQASIHADTNSRGSDLVP